VLHIVVWQVELKVMALAQGPVSCSIWQIAFMAISSTIRSPSHCEMCGINVFGIAEIAKGLFSCAKQSSLQRGQHLDANYLRSLEIDDQFVLGRCLDRQIDRLFALRGR
jgi:hypothetical protein